MDKNHVVLDYQPDPVERMGRKIKLEYLGMASVYAIIGLLFFYDLPFWYHSLLATIGAFFLFLGLKKKTEDHLSGSLILFAAVAVAQYTVCSWVWTVPYLLFGASVFVMEGYIERRQARIYALPLIFLIWSLADSSWWIGFIFVAAYLSHPWATRPGLRLRLAMIVLITIGAAFIASLIRFDTFVTSLWPFHQGFILDPLSLVVLFIMGIPTLLCLFLYWPRLVWPHRLNTLIFACLAAWDGRLAAMFGMVAAVLLSATVFRKSVDSMRLRPAFKHAEWYYFWVVFAVALWAGLARLVNSL